jgi:hypothetical protein
MPPMRPAPRSSTAVSALRSVCELHVADGCRELEGAVRCRRPAEPTENTLPVILAAAPVTGLAPTPTTQTCIRFRRQSWRGLRRIRRREEHVNSGQGMGMQLPVRVLVSEEAVDRRLQHKGSVRRAHGQGEMKQCHDAHTLTLSQCLQCCALEKHENAQRHRDNFLVTVGR